MPELPEVETVARQLGPALTGKRIAAVRIIDPKLRGGTGLPLTTRRLKGWSVSEVSRVGKQIAISFRSPTKASSKLWLVCHLRMTGRLVYYEQTPHSPSKHLRARFCFEEGELQFIDVRRFGTLKLYDDISEFAAPGLDPTTSAFTVAKFKSMLLGGKQEVKAWLLRQDKLTGLGNIYVCEALFAARVAPNRSVASLDSREISLLHKAIKRILAAAIKNCGTTFSDFQDSRGEMGGYQRYLKVYGKAGQPCKSCAMPLARIVQQQRSTFFCPACQK